MRALSSMFALMAAGVVIATGAPAHADSVKLKMTVEPGAEVTFTPELVPTPAYRGDILVTLRNNSVPTVVKVDTCKGKRLGKVAIAADDHMPHVVLSGATPASSPSCFRFSVKNLGDTPATIAGTGYF
ncbi:hypothetical protein [Streptosporangium sp. NPDC000396]|uniref:hypothetical protein n=1 Tax=Streptosporangium sp. NPDC000396 TaxID=3366185 RepID=UPI003694AD00